MVIRCRRLLSIALCSTPSVSTAGIVRPASRSHPIRLPAGDALADAEMVVFSTGWDAHWNTDRYLDHPYVAPETAARCADHNLAVGIDALSPDPTPSPHAAAEPTGFQAHHALLGNDCLLVENLTNLGGVGNRFELRAYPLALGGDGAPVRAVGYRSDG